MHHEPDTQYRQKFLLDKTLLNPARLYICHGKNIQGTKIPANIIIPYKCITVLTKHFHSSFTRLSESSFITCHPLHDTTK